MPPCAGRPCARSPPMMTPDAGGGAGGLRFAARRGAEGRAEHAGGARPVRPGAARRHGVGPGAEVRFDGRRGAAVAQFEKRGSERAVGKIWGVARESGEDKLKEIAKYKTLLGAGPAGEPARGRAVFTRTCQQCHLLFGEGGKIGPDITGSNRADLDYLLQNILDPNAVIPNDYRTSTLETKDDRSITGIVTKQDGTAVTIVTPNDTLVIPRGEVKSLTPGELSMMPEGILQVLTGAEVRDLVAYLRGTGQVPAAK